MTETRIHERFIEHRRRINLLDNGQFDVWQRGPDLNVGNTSKSADRWYNHQYSLGAGQPSYEVHRDADVPTPAECGAFNEYSMKYQITTPWTATGGDDRFCGVFQEMFGKESRELYHPNQFTTLSFWVKATKAGLYSVSVGANSSWSSLKQYTISSPATWEKKVITFKTPATLSGGLSYWYWLADAYKVRFNFNTWGPTFNGSSEDYFSGHSNYGKADETYWGETGGNYMKFAMVQYERGPVASAYDSSTTEEEQTRCEKHFQKSYAYETNPGTGIGSSEYMCQYLSSATSDSYVYIPFHQKFLYQPTVSVYRPDGSLGSSLWYKIAGSPNPHALAGTIYGITQHGFNINLGWGDEAYKVATHWIAETGW